MPRVFRRRHLRSTVWDTAHTPATLAVRRCELTGLKILNVCAAGMLSDAQAVHHLASGSQFKSSPECF